MKQSGKYDLCYRDTFQHNDDPLYQKQKRKLLVYFELKSSDLLLLFSYNKGYPLSERNCNIVLNLFMFFDGISKQPLKAK